MARAANCQASYFSQVLRGKVHLTEEQALGIAGYLELSSSETEHFLLLLRYSKAGTEKLQQYLKSQIAKSKSQQHNLSRRVPADRIVYSEEDLGKYLSSWIHSCVHILTSSPFNTVEKISERLRLPQKVVRDSLKFLTKMGFVEQEEGQWLFKSGTFHVTKESPWQVSMQTSRRQLALQSIAQNPEDSIHFSSVFTLDQTDFEELKKIMSGAIEKSHKKIQASGSEQLYALCMDLFEVI